jgi:hypothetical protein
VSKDASDSPNLLIGEVGIKDYGEKGKNLLEKRYGQLPIKKSQEKYGNLSKLTNGHIAHKRAVVSANSCSLTSYKTGCA